MGESKRILLVDDDDAFLYSASKALSGAGFEVITSTSFNSALEAIDNEPRPDLLLTDIVMPGQVHGFALARMAMMRDMAIKILYVTGHDVPTTEAAGKVLRKPLDDDELVNEVRTVLMP